MKSILRSPIEPEFAYFLRTTFRKKREALQSRLQSFWTRSQAFFLAQRKAFLKGFQQVQVRMQSLRKNEVLLSIPKKSQKPVGQAITPELSFEGWDDLKKKVKGIRFDLRERRVLAGIFILALLVGAGVKSLARDSLTIGFDDYKLAHGATLIDLNAVQERVFSGTPSEEASDALVGEQCVE